MKSRKEKDEKGKKTRGDRSISISSIVVAGGRGNKEG